MDKEQEGKLSDDMLDEVSGGLEDQIESRESVEDDDKCPEEHYHCRYVEFLAHFLDNILLLCEEAVVGLACYGKYAPHYVVGKQYIRYLIVLYVFLDVALEEAAVYHVDFLKREE